MNSFDWQFVTALCVAGVCIGLPFVFINTIRIQPFDWALRMAYALMASILFSFVASLVGECGFVDILLVQKSGCDYYPFSRFGIGIGHGPKTVLILNTLAFIFFLLLIIGLTRNILAGMFDKMKN